MGEMIECDEHIFQMGRKLKPPTCILFIFLIEGNLFWTFIIHYELQFVDRTQDRENFSLQTPIFLVSWFSWLIVRCKHVTWISGRKDLYTSSYIYMYIYIYIVYIDYELFFWGGGVGIFQDAQCKEWMVKAWNLQVEQMKGSLWPLWRGIKLNCDLTCTGIVKSSQCIFDYICNRNLVQYPTPIGQVSMQVRSDNLHSIVFW